MNSRSIVSRRRLIALAGLGAASAVLAACASPPATIPAPPPAKPTDVPKPTEAPKPAAAAATKPAGAPTAAAAATPATGAATPAAAQAPAGAAKVQLLWWSHGAEEENKKTMIGKLIQGFTEKKNGNVTVQMTWTQMPGIWQQLRGAFTANSGFPDVLWFGSDPGTEFIKAGWIAEMSQGINWDNVEAWGKKAVTFPGPDGKPGVWAIVEHASTDEIYYSKAMFKELGIAVPPRGQFSTEEFKAVVKKVTDSGKSAFANAIGDRAYPGTFITNYALLDKLGPEDLVKLWKGDLSWKDPRVLDALTFHEELVKMKAYPSTFASMTLSESHNYFHTQRKAAMFPIPSWYTARAFVPPEKGGQPKDFELGFLSYPHFADGKGKDTRYLAVGGAQTAAAKGKNVDLARELLNGYTSTDFANEWASLAALRTATKTDPSKIKSLFPDYWKDYYTSHDGVNDLAGLSLGENAKPGLSDAYTQVFNSGLPGGLLTADQAATKMEEARQKNK